MFSPLSVSSAWHSLKKHRTTESCGGKAHNDKTTADSKSQKNNLGRGGTGKQNVFNCCEFNQGIKPQNTLFFISQRGETHTHTRPLKRLQFQQKSSPLQPSVFLLCCILQPASSVVQEKWFYYGWRDECIYFFCFSSLFSVTLNTYFFLNQEIVKRKIIHCQTS